MCVCTQDGEAELWLDDDDFPDDIASTSDMDLPPQPQNCHHKLVEAYLVFIFMWQNIFRVLDVGIGVLLSFIAVLVLLLGKAFGLESLKELALSLPKSVYSARKLLGRNYDQLIKLVCCPKCSTLYKYDECILTNRNGTKTSLTCSHITFPNHRYRKYRLPCATVLMKSVKTSVGTNLYPRQLYCYCSVINALREKICLPDFIEKCERWRKRVMHSGVYEDYYYHH